jgi:acetylornithine deacetylase/succinyl-diaminopimelate desuccinylase-like protein
MPTVLTGFGPMKPNLHAPDENIAISDYIRGCKYAATIMEEYAHQLTGQQDRWQKSSIYAATQ